MLGRFDGERLRLSEVHRFPNGRVRVPDGLHWDVLRLFAEIKRGLDACAGRSRPAGEHSVWTRGAWTSPCWTATARCSATPTTTGISRTEGMLEEAFQRVPREEIFERTGIQFMRINTLYQLLSMALARRRCSKPRRPS